MSGALKAVFCLTCLFAGNMAEVTDQKSLPLFHQKSRSVSANVTQSVTVECFYDVKKILRLDWYKQTLGEKPTFMATFYHPNEVKFNGEFQNNPRFTLSSQNGINSFMISDLQSSDSATYYCARSDSSVLVFAEGTTVMVFGSDQSFPVWVNQWAPGSVQPGGSVTLQCTVHTGSCAGGARVYWFKESQEAHAGVFDSPGGSHEQCVRDATAHTHTCVYNLAESLDSSHTGIYYCAVASCGRLLFGNGTKLDFGYSRALVKFLGAALAFTSVLSLSLAFLLCVMHKRSRRPHPESPPGSSAPVTANQEDGRNQHDVQYAAVHTVKVGRPRRWREEADPECVYSNVRQ